MTLELSLKHPLFLPRFMQAQKNEPRRDIHWVGQNKDTRNEQGPVKQNDPPQKPDGSQGYRSLSSIKLSDVSEAQKYFANQLIPSPHPAWIGMNHFCNLSLAREMDNRPPMIFGRVKTCYPSDGYINNIQDVELWFPHKNGQPDPILLGANDILPSPQGIIQSFGVRVKFWGLPEDLADFQSHENLFIEQGLTIEPASDYLELLHLDDFNKDNYPWFHIVSSRWFASIPNSVQDDVRKSILQLVGWGKLILNYHPKWLPPEIYTLNRELDLNYGFSEHYLIAPESPQQAVHIVAVSLNKLFMEPMK